jgi:hypothetical protein
MRIVLASSGFGGHVAYGCWLLGVFDDDLFVSYLDDLFTGDAELPSVDIL